MIDFRLVGYVVGLIVAVLGATMLVPMLVDIVTGSPNWFAFLQGAVVSVLVGGTAALACANAARDRATTQQIFLMTTGVWLILPLFGGLPFMLGVPDARIVDAYFEGMSGMTTTGSTVFSGLDDFPRGTLLWRGMLQWFGGVGIVVVAMVFLPALGVGGMQIFRSEGFETEGKMLPRATAMAARITVVYLLLTVSCAAIFAILGMSGFDAIVHSMTTVSTGGMANYDSSFTNFTPAMHYVAAVFMILSALPFLRYVQLLAGSPERLYRDSQVRVFLAFVAVVTVLITLWLWERDGVSEPAFREAVFNSVSVISGTGFASVDYQLWGTFPVTLIFIAGLVGGCAGSTACSVKIFRYQILFSALKSQIRQIHSPHGVFIPRYDGKPVEDSVLSAVMFFFVTFILSLGVMTVLLGMTGLDFTTALTAAATAIANIGPGLGDVVGPAGNFAGLNDTAKWLLSGGMLVGRLELLAVYILFTPQFWRA